jgi:hypothetical protein
MHKEMRSAMTPRDVAKSFKLGRPLEDEIEDAIARYVMAKDKRIAGLEAVLRKTVPVLDKGTLRGDDYANELDALKREIEELLK